MVQKFVHVSIGAYISAVVGEMDTLLWHTYVIAFKHAIDIREINVSQSMVGHATVDMLMFPNTDYICAELAPRFSTLVGCMQRY